MSSPSESALFTLNDITDLQALIREDNMDPQEAREARDNIEDWLATVDLRDDVDLISQQEAPTTPAKTAPSTPLHNPLRLLDCGTQLIEHVSPTDSNFSLDHVFDSPISPIDWSSIPELNRPRRGYADTEASSIEGEEDDESAAHTEIPAESAPLSIPIHTPAPDFDPNANHLIFLTSCIQCVLSDLPCSRTLPACSRCVRHARGHLCLAQRKRVHAEVINPNDNTIVDTNPILIMREGDNEDIYSQKVELQKELIQTWKDDQDRRNWVIPLNNGVRGYWKTAASQSRLGLEMGETTHPGEGIGPKRSIRMQILRWHEYAMRRVPGSEAQTGDGNEVDGVQRT